MNVIQRMPTICLLHKHVFGLDNAWVHNHLRYLAPNLHMRIRRMIFAEILQSGKRTASVDAVHSLCARANGILNGVRGI